MHQKQHTRVWLILMYRSIGRWMSHLNPLGVLAFAVFDAVLMHHPVGPQTLRSSTLVVDQCLLHANRSVLVADPPIFACWFPVSCLGCTVRAASIWILPIPWPKEVPLGVSARQEWFLFQNKDISISVRKDEFSGWATEWTLVSGYLLAPRAHICRGLPQGLCRARCWDHGPSSWGSSSQAPRQLDGT